MIDALKPGFELSRRWRLVWLVVATAICAGLLPVGAVSAVYAWVMFDDRRNLFNPLACMAFFPMIGLWIACILGPFVAWVFWSRGRERRAWLAIATPLIWACATLTLLQFVPD
jgi:hypothetical protein